MEPLAGEGMLVFDDFAEGALLGEHTMCIDRAMLDGWADLFPEDDVSGAIPAGLVAVVSMRSYTNVVAARPPGNVHGMQSYAIERLPLPGEPLRTEVWCRSKQIRKERRWIEFETTTYDATGARLFGGVATLAWAR